MGGNILGSGAGQANNLNTASNLNQNERSNLGVQQQQIPGAPPINRLVDMLNKTSFTPSNTSGFASPNDASTANRVGGAGKFTSADFYVNNSNQDLPFTPNHGRVSPPSPNQVDPFYNYGESIKIDEKLDDCWITIFGFPPSATSYVLQEFSVYGQILKHLVRIIFCLQKFI
jgi:nuclear pore complex protein Nup53